MADSAHEVADDELVSQTLRKFFNLGRGRIRKFEEERFFTKVAPNGDCWNFTGGTRNKGYGQFLTDDRRTAKAHRWSWEHFHGPVPEGLVLDHLCRNRACVNPDHLDPVTNAVNVRRGIAPPAVNAAKASCERGHGFTADNTYFYPDGRRECRTCSREYKKAWNRRNIGESAEN